MKDEGKTNKQIVDEPISSRKQIAKIEKSTEKLKQAEETLKQKELLFNKFVESSPIAMLLLDGVPPQIKYTNTRFARLFGYSADDIPDIDHWWSLAFPDPAYRKEVRAAWNRKFKEVSITQFEYKPVERVVTCKDGSQKHIEFRTVSIGTTYLSFGIDITERKRAEEESKEKEERFNALFNRSFDCVYIHDFNGHLLDANPALLDLLEYKREEAASMNLGALIDKKQREKALKVIKELKQTGSQRPLTEYQLRCKDGKQVYMETKASVIYRDNKPYAILGIGRDITERKKAEALLRKKTKALQLHSIKLHELNTTLKVLLKQREEDKRELEEKVMANVKELLLPYLEELNKGRLDSKSKVQVSILETNLKNIVSPFTHRLSSKYSGFTPREIQVANLIRQEKSTKEIAEYMGVSRSAINLYRNNIRRKLGIISKKINLKSHLMSLS